MAVTVLEAPRPRIGLQAIALLGAALLLLAVAGVSAWSFITPNVGHEYRLGPASAFAPGSVTTFYSDGERLAPYTTPSPNAAWGWYRSVPRRASVLVHVVRLPDGELRVLAGVSPHLGQTVLWFPDATAEVGDYRGLFSDDFSLWAVDGTRIFGPAPRDLPTYRYFVDDGALVIDLSEPVDAPWLPDQRGRLFSRQILPPYDVLDPAWPTSGWPSLAAE